MASSQRFVRSIVSPNIDITLNKCFFLKKNTFGVNVDLFKLYLNKILRAIMIFLEFDVQRLLFVGLFFKYLSYEQFDPVVKSKRVSLFMMSTGAGSHEGEKTHCRVWFLFTIKMFCHPN